MFKKTLSAFAVLVFSAAATIPSAKAQNAFIPAVPQIVSPIDESNTIPLRGNTRPEATPASDRGIVAGDLPLEHILLQLRRSPQREQALRTLIDQLHDIHSPNYHQWLTAQEIGERYGVSPQDRQAITDWLTVHGFKINDIHPGGLIVDFSGTAAQVQEAFHTEVHALSVNGVRHFGNISDPQIPAALRPVIEGIVSLNDFQPRAQHVNFNEDRNPGTAAHPDFTTKSGSRTVWNVVPKDLEIIYNYAPLLSANLIGQGQKIALIEASDMSNVNDWNTFRTTFALVFPSASLTQVHPGGCGDPGVTVDDSEATLDAEWATASAPGAAIELDSCAATYVTTGAMLALKNILAEPSPAKIISLSYGECETYLGAAQNASFNSLYQQAVAEGISVYVSTSDSGAAGCDNFTTTVTHGIGANGYSSTPFNVAVSGNDFGDTYQNQNNRYWYPQNGAHYSSAVSYIPEIPWDHSCASTILAQYYTGSSLTYGTSGACNNQTLLGQHDVLNTQGGGGAPSGCATGAPSTTGVVSGTCKGWPKPSWQSGVTGIPNDGVRDTPDLSLFASNGMWGHVYVYCWSNTARGGKSCAGTPDTWTGGGGSSFAAPIMAGIQAIVNQKYGAQGNPNYALYALAHQEYGSTGSANTACKAYQGNLISKSCIFHDLTTGNNALPCTGKANCYTPSGTNGVLSTSNYTNNSVYNTGPGWDFVSGIGTMNAANLVNSWPHQ